MILKASKEALKEAVEILKKGGIIVAPTDTLYGILADATNEEAVKRLYKIRRPSGKPFLVLLPDESWLEKLCLDVKEEHKKLLKVEGLTLVFRKTCDKLDYVSKGTLAVRLPQKGFIRDLLSELKKPVVAPSVNPEGKKPAESVEEAYNYFGNKVDLYIDAGVIKGEPSTILDLTEGVKILREGKVKKEEIEKILNRKL
ncbi:L-threonylcarbamoyladenylate synthase [Aquifex aeolicus]|uniref:L-threonylcarbamoyladenylate synthase n=1 Tax=Aquifex aeolicus (strain VF5) TaxID=224324 RepID=O66889_AQUAE|nr:L-threonylcarbamoyladenylate synthase [Aquifex aeolicus]AAC06854.1 hypothetical protein aq_651 [Aquifex aeolicus VF5]